MLITGRMWECEVCRWRWMYVEGRKPERCPNPKCRARKWNAKGDENGDRLGGVKKASSGVAATAGDGGGH